MKRFLLHNRMAILWLLAAVMLLSASAVRAADVPPDLSRAGEISVTLKSPAGPVSGGSLTLCRVGEIRLQEGVYRYMLTPEFEKSGVDLSDLSDITLAYKLSEYRIRNKISGITREFSADGTVVFPDLEPGLWLAGQETPAEGFLPLSSFLVTVPSQTETGWDYTVDASPKVEIHPEPSTEPSGPTEPTEPEKPEIPYTGQLNWPVPLMIAGGVILFCIGWVLRRKGNDHEA